MVFLGGAVLANIVSIPGRAAEQGLIFLDGRQGEHVDIKARVGGARGTSLGETRCAMSIAIKTRHSNASIPNEHKCSILADRATFHHLAVHVEQ